MQLELDYSCEDEMPSPLLVIRHRLTERPHVSNILHFFIVERNEVH